MPCETPSLYLPLVSRLRVCVSHWISRRLTEFTDIIGGGASRDDELRVQLVREFAGSTKPVKATKAAPDKQKCCIKML